MKMTPVESSTIHSIGYDHATQTMAVRFQFKDGTPSSLYHYANVEPDMFTAVRTAPSVGSFLQNTIKREPVRWPATRIDITSHPEEEKETQPARRSAIDINDPGQQITLLHDQWKDYREENIPLALTDEQVSIMQQAFYAGARGVLNALEDCMAENLPDEEVGKVLPAIGIEIQRYLDSRAARHN